MAKSQIHDLILNDGTAYGFMLARSKGVRGWGIQDATTIAPMLRTGEMTQADSPPQVELKWFQDDWQGGIGGKLHRLHPRQYGLSPDASGLKNNRLEAGQDWTGPTYDLATDVSSVTGYAIWGTEKWAFIGTYPYQWDWTNKNWDRKTRWATTSTPLGRNGVLYESWVVVPTWKQSDNTPLDYYAKNTAGDTWAQPSAGTPRQFKYFAVADGKLWGGYVGTTKNAVRSCTNPTAPANWSGETLIGTSDAEITNLLSDGTTLLVCKTDGLWTLSPDGTVVHLTPEWKGLQHPHHFRGAINWNGRYLLGLGTPGLFQLRGSVLTDISIAAPESYVVSDTSAFDPSLLIFLGFAAEPHFVYALATLAALTSLALLKGELVVIEGEEAIRWHCIRRISLTAQDRQQPPIFMDGSTGPSGEIHRRIWLGYSAASGATSVFIPSDTDADYNADDPVLLTYLWTTAWDANLPNVDKNFDSLKVTAENVGTSAGFFNTIGIHYSIDGGTWTSLGTIESSSQTFSFASGTTGKKICLKFTFNRQANGTGHPTILSFLVEGQLRPTAAKLLQFAFKLADGMRLRNGSVERQMTAKLTKLRAWNTQAAPVTMTDPEGASRSIVFIPGTMKEQEVASEAGRRPEKIVSMVALEV